MYKRQTKHIENLTNQLAAIRSDYANANPKDLQTLAQIDACLLYTSDAADERSSVDLGGRRIIKKKKCTTIVWIDK